MTPAPLCHACHREIPLLVGSPPDLPVICASCAGDDAALDAWRAAWVECRARVIASTNTAVGAPVE